MRGFSTIELLIALMLLSTVLIAAMLLILGAPLVLESAREHFEARTLAESVLMREVRRLPDGFEDITSYSTTEEYAVRLTSLLLPDEATKRLVATVSWQRRSAQRSVSLTTYVTDYLHPSDYPCDILPRGRWNALQSVSRAVARGDLLPEAFPASIAVTNGIAATRTHVALSAVSAAGNAPSFFLFSISDGSLQYRSSLAISSTTAAVADMALTENYAYIASASTCAIPGRCGQLKIIDLATPRMIAQLLLPRTTPPYAGDASVPVAARSVTYRDGYVYLGLEQTPTALGQEFNIIDVRNPSEPLWVGGFRVGRTVNDIMVRAGRAFIATNARGNADVLILDVSDPLDIRELGRIALSPQQPTSRFGYAHVLGLYGDELHVGRSYISNADEWVLIDSSDPGLPVRMSRNRGTALNPASIRALMLRESQAILLMPHALEVWDRSEPYDPRLMDSLSMSSEATGAVCVGNAIYVAATNGVSGELIRVAPI